MRRRINKLSIRRDSWTVSVLFAYLYTFVCVTMWLYIYVMQIFASFLFPTILKSLSGVNYYLFIGIKLMIKSFAIQSWYDFFSFRYLLLASWKRNRNICEMRNAVDNRCTRHLCVKICARDDIGVCVCVFSLWNHFYNTEHTQTNYTALTNVWYSLFFCSLNYYRFVRHSTNNFTLSITLDLLALKIT